MKALLLPGSPVWKDFLMENAAFFMGGRAVDDVMWTHPPTLFLMGFISSFYFAPALLSSGRVL